MEIRQEKLLASIVEEYARSAVPVGSKLLERSTRLGVSSATIRNEMAELEGMGYIMQPHTSAGRIPTEKGYIYCIENDLCRSQLSQKEEEALKRSFHSGGVEGLKSVAKTLAGISGLAVLIKIGEGQFFYTGISNLFGQPEFSHADFMMNISSVIDVFGDILAKITGTSTSDVQVKIGKHNPFGNECGSVMGSISFQKRHEALVVILGPLRQQYAKNSALLRKAQKIVQ